MSKSDSKNANIAILMSIRNEEAYIDLNISYHLDLGFNYIFIINHCSTDETSKILKDYKNDPRVIVIGENKPVFDHAKMINKLLKYANLNYKIDWFVFLDVDEFLSIQDKTIHGFVSRLEKNKIPYATIGWANALFDYTFSDYTCSPVHAIDTMKYYHPWPEKKWQEYGHFRKAIVKNYKGIEVVAGGHYIKTENNPSFFGDYHWNPFIVPEEEAQLLHFEFRNNAKELYKKWEKLALFENDSTSKKDSPWLERIGTIKEYVKRFRNDVDEIEKRWFSEHRTFWGTTIPKDRIVNDATLISWYGKYFKKKIKSKKIKSVYLVRKGNLGDVIMTEPIARLLSKYVNRVNLITNINTKNIKLALGTYNNIYKFNRANLMKARHKTAIKLIYELSSNQKTYIQGYMESIGFDKTDITNIPKLNNEWEDIVNKQYILLAPLTSNWEKKKRNWGHKKFVKLSRLLEKEYKIKCLMLGEKHSFREMLSLIKNCEFFVGNDSGPGIIAQSFKKKAFIIFGATHPKYAHTSKKTIPVYDKNRHKLCKHVTRKEEIDCCEEFCLDRIGVNEVFTYIKSNI